MHFENMHVKLHLIEERNIKTVRLISYSHDSSAKVACTEMNGQKIVYVKKHTKRR